MQRMPKIKQNKKLSKARKKIANQKLLSEPMIML